MSGFETGRYERKYVIAEAKAAAVRQFVSAYMMPDPHMDMAAPWGYRVNSLYLDSQQLDLYRQTTQGIKNRFKLRMRFYDEAAEAPAFLEIKRRASETILKQRAVVAKQAAEILLHGGWVGSAELVSPGRDSVRDLAEFCELQRQLDAVGTAVVSYWREAYVLPYAEGARVTFDRHVVGHAPGFGLAIAGPGTAATTGEVVLELKYIGRAPGWMKDLVRSFNLERVSFPKYVYCINALRRASAMAG
jgi:SPX domain protein involved in polyphosphate accumulation